MAPGKLVLVLCLSGACWGIGSCGRSRLGASGVGSGEDSGHGKDSGSREDSGSGQDSAVAILPDAYSGKDALTTPDADSGNDVLIFPKADTQVSTCGNGIFDPGEQCDDGNTQSGDGCSNLCKLECNWMCGCGDPNEICRYVGVCGDGVLSSSEGCDDGNTTNGDGCSANCEIEPHWRCRVPGRRCTPICGDGILLGTETCDDGNTMAGDGCGENCLLEGGALHCGDGVISGGEECDDGAFNNDAEYGACTAKCQYSFCGDGIVNGAEECDLGQGQNNSAYGDAQGCTSQCTRPHYCGDGILDDAYGEMCDLGTDNGRTYCTVRCIYIID